MAAGESNAQKDFRRNRGGKNRQDCAVQLGRKHLLRKNRGTDLGTWGLNKRDWTDSPNEPNIPVGKLDYFRRLDLGKGRTWRLEFHKNDNRMIRKAMENMGSLRFYPAHLRLKKEKILIVNL